MATSPSSSGPRSTPGSHSEELYQTLKSSGFEGDFRGVTVTDAPIQDQLVSWANEHNTDPVEILRANNISDTSEITPGQELAIPKGTPGGMGGGLSPPIKRTDLQDTTEQIAGEEGDPLVEQLVGDLEKPGELGGEGFELGGETITMAEDGTTVAVDDLSTPAPGDMVTKKDTEAGIDLEAVSVDEPKLDGPPVVEEEIAIEEEPGEPGEPGITEVAIATAKNVAKTIIDSSPEDSKPVLKDVFAEIDALGIEAQTDKKYYEKIAKDVNDRIKVYNKKISDIAEEKMKPTFEGWDKFLAVLGAAMGAYGSAMTGTPNFALNIINKAIDRDTQAFLNSKEIRTKSLENQRMDLIMMRGEKLQMAQNRVSQLMQSETFKLAKAEAKANIQAVYDKLDQELVLNKQNTQLVMAGMIKDFMISDATLRSSLAKEDRKRYVNSYSATDAGGNTVIIPGYIARDAKSAEKLTEDQKATEEALGYISELDELYESPEKYIPAWAGGKVSQRIDYITNRLELTFKRLEGMGANYTQYEQALIRGILPTSSLIDKISKYKVKSASLRNALIKGLQTSAKVRGITGNSAGPLLASQSNIEKFSGKKISN